MSTGTVALFAGVVILVVAVSGSLRRFDITTPALFTALGVVLGLTLVDTPPEDGTVRSIAELTLALLLFHDAAQVRPHQLRGVAGMCARLLLLGLPLTIAAGFLFARLVFPGLPAWSALLIAATLAPTDAGLGAATVLNPVVPVRIRRVLNVESGLNDGLATPVVLVAIALGQDGGSVRVRPTVVHALAELGVGLAVGALLGAGTAWLVSQQLVRQRVDATMVPLAAVAVPLAAYYGAVALQGNGFIAAFSAGVAFAGAWSADATASAGEAEGLDLTDHLATLLGFAVWTLFGLVAVARLATGLDLAAVVFAVAALTVLRMLPVAAVLLGTGLRAPTVAFIGWFGPRGLASVVFALIALESLPPSHTLDVVASTIGLTVLLSVAAHGMSAAPGAAAYGRWVARARPTVELADASAPAVSALRTSRGAA